MRSNLDNIMRKLDNFKIRVKDTEYEVNKLLAAGNRTASVMRKIGGSEDFATVLSNIQRLVNMFMALQRAAHLAQIATGPFGLFMAGLSFASLGASVYDMTRGY